MHLNIYAKIQSTKTLGPGQRYVLWVQGCPFRCHDCMTPRSQPFEGGTSVPVEDLVNEIMQTPGIEGITLSGGEPFSQAKALGQLIEQTREVSDLGVIVYTGYRYQDLHSVLDADLLLKNTDLLIDGPYIAKLDDGKSLRGSSNQNVMDLTGRYKPHLSKLYDQKGRQAEIRFIDDEAMIIGVAGKQTLHAWRSLSQPNRGTEK
jgi:anaerobic ribonucleoside-triphosphate reductase activating protein